MPRRFPSQFDWQPMRFAAIAAAALALATLTQHHASADSTTSPMVPGGSAGTRAVPAPLGGADYGESNAAKARSLVDAAINMTDSDRAVKLLWQATDLDPTLGEAYMYLGLYYNSRSQFDKVVEVFQKEVKYEPKELNAYLNIGEAYMSYTPPKFDSALPYFRKGFEIDPTSSFAALRIGQISAEQNNRADAVRFLKLASADRAKNPAIADEADRLLRQMYGP